jgi:tetratricopeptide (TPR) repeat protein
MTEQASEQSIFLHAIGLPSPAERAAYLDDACRDNTALRKELDALLSAHDRLGGLSPTTCHDRASDSAADGAVSLSDGETVEHAGTVISGRYKLVEQIGEGGMGSVWMAQQTEPVKRLVALKLIKPGMDSKQVLARFEAERQALALMEHPNIARVLDAGTTATGRPYFVMELVKGVPITRFCDEHRLTPKERLELFFSVCQAVQHAHQKGVIHRDIKPSNVLVASYDGKAVPKVIDFGIAKATGEQLTEKTLVTGFGAIVGTLEYMSPEQAELNALNIDTRSDIYSLGVLLYELLTGTTPLEKKRLQEAAMLEVLRLIREEEPPRPSTRISTADAMPSIAANRRLEPRKLSGLVRGELDWIVMKALEKDRNRRYETASSFAADVQRYLHDEPVLACPPSAGYRVRKFVRRHKGRVIAAAAILILVLAGTAVSTWQAVRATLAERKTSKALTQATVAKEQTRQALDALTENVVQNVLAKQLELDETEKTFLRQVLVVYQAVALEGADTAQARFLQAEGHFKVAHMHGLIGDRRAAVKGYELARGLLEELAEEFPKEAEYRHKLARTTGNLAILLAELGKETEAEEALLQGIVLRTNLAHEFPKKGEYRSELGKNYNDLAYLRERQQKYEEAAKTYRTALAWHEKLVAEPDALPAYHQALARNRSGLAGLLRKQEKYTEAEKLYDQAVKVQREQLKKFPDVPRCRRQLADSYQGLGIVLAELGREDESETTFEQSVELRKKLVELFPRVRDYRRELAATYNDLGYLQSRRKKLADAEHTYRLSLDVQKKLMAEAGALPAYRELLSRGYTNLGAVLRDQKKVPEAEEAYRESLKLDLKLIADFPKDTKQRGGAANVLVLLAQLRQQQKDFKAAVPLLTQAGSHLKAALDRSPRHPAARKMYRDTLRQLATSYLSLADHAGLAATGEELARFDYEPANDTFGAATMLSSCVMVVNKEAKLDDGKRRELAQGYADRAMTLVRQAIERGFKNVERMQKDPRLEPLRERDEYRKLLTDLKGKEK